MLATDDSFILLQNMFISPTFSFIFFKIPWWNFRKKTFSSFDQQCN